jgi:hypothetical protein
MNTADDTKREIVNIAKSIIDDGNPDLQRIRRICDLGFRLDDEEITVLLTLKGIESETDEFPVGDVRKNFPTELLEKFDYEVDTYLSNVRNIIIDVCNEIVECYSKP